MSLKKQAISGVKWNSLSKFTLVLLQLFQMLILARLLSPSEFGLFGMITVVIGFSKVFVDMGLSNAIIHAKELDDQKLSTLYWMNILMGMAIAALIFTISPLISNFYNEEKLTGLIKLMSITFLIIPLGQQFEVLMQKNLMFKFISIIEIFSFTLGVTISVALALCDYGVFSIVWGQLANSSFRVLLLCFFSPRTWYPKFLFKYKAVRNFMSFGLYQLGERSVNYLSNNIDYIFIGKFLGADALGLYTLAYQIVILPISKINPIITKVAFPIFSKIQDDVYRLREGYYSIATILSLIVFPMLLGLIALADNLVPVVFGEKWVEVIPVIQILGILGIIRTLGNPSSSVYLALGRADIGFKLNVTFALMNAIILGTFVHLGLIYFSAAYVALVLAQFCILNFVFKSLIQLRVVEYFGRINKSLLISITMSVVVYIWNNICNIMDFSEIITLGTSLIIGVFIYVCLQLKFNMETLSRIKSIKSESGIEGT